jgi:hypothetical protein
MNVSLIGFVVTVAIATSSATLILWLDLSRYVERSCSNQQPPMIDCGAWAGIGYGMIHLYRRHQNSKPATANFKPGH